MQPIALKAGPMIRTRQRIPFPPCISDPAQHEVASELHHSTLWQYSKTAQIPFASRVRNLLQYLTRLKLKRGGFVPANPYPGEMHAVWLRRRRHSPTGAPPAKHSNLQIVAPSP